MRTAFCAEHGVETESEYKLRRRDAGELTWHAHIGLSDWDATEAALDEIIDGLAEHRYTLDRFGLCLSRAMSLPAAERTGAAKETGPVLEADDWARVAAAPVQPHLGDFMIGTPAGLENTQRALAVGITTIGNLGQHFAFEPPGGYDDEALTGITVDAIGALAARGGARALLPRRRSRHAVQPLRRLPGLGGARAAHRRGPARRAARPLLRRASCPNPAHRAIVGLALDHLRDGDSLGSMVYGNTVEYGPDRQRNLAVLTTSVMIDVATQLRRPTGHALNPVPLSEAERIPDADEILEVHLMARELEIEVRRGAPLLDWAWAERRAAEAVAYARAFRDGALAHFADAGADPGDAGALLLALRRTTPAALERAIRIPASRELLELETWKHGVVATVAERARRSLPRLDGRRIVLAALEVHDVVRDALARELPQAGAQVIVLPSSISPEQLARAAADEDADTVIVATYNGGALTLGKALMRTLPADVTVIFGGVLNEDDGGPLPVDARPGLEALGIRCVGEIEQLGAALA